ncbi:MAG: glutathione S-transferase N-terminal domain-containing protein [Candidatus Vogelbacteria bacterium]|nr:glutathione S-transferase N-terminal domain-containing protein [Candidatus Vogelbacteria bacterium]
MSDKLTKHKVIIYSTPSCVYCKVAKEYFKDNNVEYTEYNVVNDIPKREEMFQKSGQMGVPVIDIDGSITVGFDEERIQSFLGI